MKWHIIKALSNSKKYDAKGFWSNSMSNNLRTHIENNFGFSTLLYGTFDDRLGEHPKVASKGNITIQGPSKKSSICIKRVQYLDFLKL